MEREIGYALGMPEFAGGNYSIMNTVADNYRWAHSPIDGSPFRVHNHRQAREVHTLTGELVACICADLDCCKQLPANYIAQQKALAYRTAYCEHVWIDLTELGRVKVEQICANCPETRTL